MDVTLPEPLNSLIGKLETKAVTNLFGGPGTGKTNFCMLAMIDCARKGGKVVYMDSEGGLSFERMKQLAHDHEALLSRVELLEPHTFAEQGEMIRKLGRAQADLIVVDSMVALYRLEYGEEKKSSERMDHVRELSRQLSILSAIARTKDIPVLVTSHMFRGWDNGEPDVVGGDMMKYWSKTIIYLERTGRMSERKATVTKHRFAPEGGNVKFQLVSDGIKPSGFRIF